MNSEREAKVDLSILLTFFKTRRNAISDFHYTPILQLKVTRILLFVMVEWNNRYKIEPLSGKFSWLKVSLSIIAIIALGIFTDYKNFIYFQF